MRHEVHPVVLYPRLRNRRKVRKITHEVHPALLDIHFMTERKNEK